MHGVNRLRSLRLRYQFMPWVLAALILRVLIPADAMMAVPGLRLQASLCSLQDTGDTGDTGRTGTIELPGARSAPECEHCLAPLLDAPLAMHSLPEPRLADSGPFGAFDSQVSESTPQRPASARAPPRA